MLVTRSEAIDKVGGKEVWKNIDFRLRSQFYLWTNFRAFSKSAVLEHENSKPGIWVGKDQNLIMTYHQTSRSVYLSIHKMDTDKEANPLNRLLPILNRLLPNPSRKDIVIHLNGVLDTLTFPANFKVGDITYSARRAITHKNRYLITPQTFRELGEYKVERNGRVVRKADRHVR